MLEDAEVVARLLLAAASGAAIGFERELKDQPAGFRTHILVCIGACLFSLISAYGFEDAAPGQQRDVARIASQVVVGIGFLGAGTIVRQKGSVKGLTTAASLWVTAAVGVAMGSGFYTGAGVAVGIVLLSLLLKPLERRWFPKSERALREDEPPSEDDDDEEGSSPGDPGQGGTPFRPPWG